ncbi:MAG: response regulator [Verrucomicrobiales bacterium]|nr:response regulator [Verrucomicrobiales bacterium]
MVEDREEDRFLLALLLRRLGLTNTILQLPDGEQAIHYLSAEGIHAERRSFPLPSVLFLDLRMPRKSGFTVLEWLRANPLPNPVLVFVVSDSLSRGDIQRAYQLGASSFISKPLNEAEIRECIRSHPQFWEFEDPSL